jgi:hypothetical protein
MTFAQWYHAIRSLDHKSPQARALCNQYPQHHIKLLKSLKSVIKPAKQFALNDQGDVTAVRLMDNSIYVLCNDQWANDLFTGSQRPLTLEEQADTERMFKEFEAAQ